jgi:hypothetical protein
VRVVVSVDGHGGGYLSDCGGGVSERGGVGNYGRGSNDSSTGYCHQGGEDKKLWAQRGVTVAVFA